MQPEAFIINHHAAQRHLWMNGKSKTIKCICKFVHGKYQTNQWKPVPSTVAGKKHKMFQMSMISSECFQSAFLKQSQVVNTLKSNTLLDRPNSIFLHFIVKIDLIFCFSEMNVFIACQKMFYR